LSFPDFVPVLHVMGYLAACAIYGMLLAMVWRAGWSDATRLPFAAGALGLMWNLGSLFSELSDLGFPDLPEPVDALTYSAMAFLPAVVVHSVLRDQLRPAAQALISVAYAASAVASVGHFVNIAVNGYAPWPFAAHWLGPAFGFLIVPLALVTGTQSTWKRALWMFALAVFAITGQEIAYHTDTSLFLDLVGHHASMPLAFVILYQEYRFALADRFLKSALKIITLVSIVMASFVLLVPALGTDLSDPRVLGVVMALWIATALVSPSLGRAISRSVDRWFLGRDGYGRLRAAIAASAEIAETSSEVLTHVGDEISRTLGGSASWEVAVEPTASTEELVRLSAGRDGAELLVPTAEEPHYTISIGNLSEGRRLVSEDAYLLEWAALAAARRIDRLRTVNERYEHELREQEMRKLATEAELRVLRAQLNPHFLFNALTTIGHLIRAAPERALETLLNLTELLRRVLRSTEETTSLGDELDLVMAYLDIERARFEERLRVVIDVPDELRSLRVPPLILQPLVENAVKHGIGPLRDGGVVTVRGERAPGVLRLAVEDTGAGAHETPRGEGVGLGNVEERLRGYYGDEAALSFESRPGVGTRVELSLPIETLAHVSTR